MAKEMTLGDLFHDTLKDIFFAERQVRKALPKMARAAVSQDTRALLLLNAEVTEGQIVRLERIFEMIGKRPQGKTCEAIQGIIAQGEEIIEEFRLSDALEAGVISSVQAIVHYSTARYGTLAVWANQLGLKEASQLLTENLKEEEALDERLTWISQIPPIRNGATKVV